MNFIRTKSATYVLSAFVAAAFLAACSSGGTQPASPSSGLGMSSSASHHPGSLGRSGPGHMYLGVKWRTPKQRNHVKSWISPDVMNSPRLLFAADAGNQVVNIFRMTNHSMDYKGALAGPDPGTRFEYPQGECGDSRGNIYVADTEAQKVYAFTRTGTSAFATYDTAAFGHPASCAWDPSTGNLAVTLLSDTGGGDGAVLIYSSASQAPTEISNPGQAAYYFAGYSPSGDLWEDGFDSSGNFVVAFCGASSCTTIPISGGTIFYPGAVQFDRVRGEWVVFDQQCNGAQSSCSYVVAGSGALSNRVDYFAHNGSEACDVVQAVIGADNGNLFAAGGDADTCGNSSASVDRWAYPAGGVPTTHSSEQIIDPSGSAISNKNK